MKEQAPLSDLYQRLLAGDPTAPAELAEAVMPSLHRMLQRKFADVDPELIADAVTDAVMALILRPDAYDPHRGGFEGYLLMSAQGDLLNSLARQRRRSQREVSVDSVEHLAPDPETQMEDSIGSGDDTGDLVPDTVFHLLPGPIDRQVLQLMMDGERRTHVFARVLQVSDRPESEQRRIVKRHKDRIKKKLQRFLRRRAEGRRSP